MGNRSSKGKALKAKSFTPLMQTIRVVAFKRGFPGEKEASLQAEGQVEILYEPEVF